MLTLGSQYYRPPTPDPALWEDDIRRMKETGLNTLQLWAVWGWIEPEPGRFAYDDYDRLVEIAGSHGMKVVISTITDVQPFWMPRVYPDAHMVDEAGSRVVGTPRGECLPGVTPGLCTDHAGIRDLSMRFMRNLAAHYRTAPALLAWDCWNETRWCVHCGKWVCYCDASLAAFREFVRRRYGSLGALGEAWGRRMVSWDDVRPARAGSMLSPALLDFGRWMIQRARETAAWRCRAIREGDPDHPIAAHAPCAVTRDRGLADEEAPFARGNDFDNAAELDAFGTSTFPAWWQSDPADIGVLMEATRSVAAPRPFWLSELQGGAFSQGFLYGIEVSGPLQQFWTWSAYARGAKAVLYWCWRDEVWGVESGGFGIVGQDGRAPERLRELRQTSRLLREHETALDAYVPDPATVGVVFDSDSVLVALCNREGNSHSATFSITGTLRALERCRLAFDLLDGRSLAIPDAIRLLLLPGALCVKPAAAEAIAAFMQRGGWVFCEAATGMFTDNGFFHDRPADRDLVGRLAIGQARRRDSRADARCTVPENTWGAHAAIELRGALWSLALESPSGGRVLARDTAGDAMLIEVPVGRGGLVMSGTFPAYPYCTERHAGYEQLLLALAARAGALPPWQVSAREVAVTDNLSVRTGRAGRTRLFFLLNAGAAGTVRVRPPEAAAAEAHEWFAGSRIAADAEGFFAVEMPGTGYRILEWDAG